MKKHFQSISEIYSTIVTVFYIFVFFIVSCGVACAGSDEYCKQPIKLAFYEFGYFYYDGKGMDKDIVDELQKRSGCRFEVQVMARARIWADLASGDLDMSVSGVQSPERDKFAWFAHYLSVKNYAIVYSKIAATVKTADDFLARPELQMGAVTSFRHGKDQDDWLSRLRRVKRVQESPDAETIFMKLKDDRVDAIFSHPPVYRYYLSFLGMENSVVIQDWTPLEKGIKAGLVMSKHRFSEAQADKWRSLILDMKKDGTLRKIYLKYLPENEVDSMLKL